MSLNATHFTQCIYETTLSVWCLLVNIFLDIVQIVLMRPDFDIPHRVIQSKSKDFSVGDHVIGVGGWCTHYVTNSSDKSIHKLTEDIPVDKLSITLGVCGMPG